MRKALLTATIMLIASAALQARAGDTTSLLGKITNFPNKVFSRINSKAADLNKRLDKQTERYLAKLSRQEEQLKKKLFKTDSVAAKRLFPDNYGQQYASLLQKLKSDTTARTGPPTGDYYPYVDSLQTSMSFLKQNPQLLDASKAVPANMQSAMANMQVLQAKMQDADLIKQYVQQRKEQLKQYLSKYTQIPPSIMSSYAGYNKEMYYYGQQVQEYKDILNDPDKMMKTALQLLSKVPAFTSFMQHNSILASLFSMPGGNGPLTPGLPGQGLSSRDQVLAAFQNQVGAGGPDLSSVMRQNMQSAQGQASQLTDKLTSYGSGGAGADVDIPDFKPNGQKSKSFLKRLIYGTDLQTVHSNYFFPATSDLGLSIGYKLDDNNSLGVGGSVKVGWGKDISHISLSWQGASLRSFADFRIKKSFFASGGFEYNYQQPFSPGDIPGLRSWQQSGLVGISKIVSLKTKVFKSTKLQLLWDFLSYEQRPRAQAFKFRVGYSF